MRGGGPHLGSAIFPSDLFPPPPRPPVQTLVSWQHVPPLGLVQYTDRIGEVKNCTVYPALST